MSDAHDSPDHPLPGESEVLADVRGLLDVLDATRAAPGLLSTTIEMAAVASAPGSPGARPAARRPQAWWLAVVAVAGGLGAGWVAGRATSPDPDEPVLQYLPVVEHLDALQEAGSVAFLEEVSRREIAEPRRFRFPRAADAPPGEESDDPGWPELDDAVEALRYVTFGPETPAGEMAARRDRIEEMEDDELRHVADRATAYRQLPREVRHDLIVLARALGESDDGRLGTLLEAARVWHRWVDWSDPADRQAVVALDGTDRLEWLERRSRFPGRGQWPGGRAFPGGRGLPLEGGRGGAEVNPQRTPEAPGENRPARR